MEIRKDCMEKTYTMDKLKSVMTQSCIYRLSIAGNGISEGGDML